MNALTINAFPGVVRGPTETYDTCRAMSDGHTLWVFTAAGSTARLAASPSIVSVEELNPEPYGRWSATDTDGNVWEISKAGGCGCGHPLKRIGWQQLLDSIGVYE